MSASGYFSDLPAGLTMIVHAGKADFAAGPSVDVARRHRCCDPRMSRHDGTFNHSARFGVHLILWAHQRVDSVDASETETN